MIDCICGRDKILPMWSDSDSMKHTVADKGYSSANFRNAEERSKSIEEGRALQESAISVPIDSILREGRILRKLTYFRNGLIKRFPNWSRVDIDIVIEQTLEAMKPSRDRTRLKRLVVKELSSKSSPSRSSVPS